MSSLFIPSSARSISPYNHVSRVPSKSVAPSPSRRTCNTSVSNALGLSLGCPPPSPDPYYGLEETSALCARFVSSRHFSGKSDHPLSLDQITSLFQCPNVPTATHPDNATPPLAHFVAYALHRTRLHSMVMFAALLLLQRLKTRFPAARGSSGHRLFIAAFVIASKVISDETYSNRSWGIVAQNMFDLEDVNQMERELCAHLQWNLNIQGDELSHFSTRVRFQHGSPRSWRLSWHPFSTSHRPYSQVFSDARENAKRIPTASIGPLQSPTRGNSRLFSPKCPLHPSPGGTVFSPPSDPSQPLHFTSAGPSLVSSPASYWNSPSAVIMTPHLCDRTRMTDAGINSIARHNIASSLHSGWSSSADVRGELEREYMVKDTSEY